MANLTPLIQQYISMVGQVYPGQIPFNHRNYGEACELHDHIRDLEMAEPGFKLPAKSWQEHLDSVP
jgi:hypothetical protein